MAYTEQEFYDQAKQVGIDAGWGVTRWELKGAASSMRRDMTILTGAYDGRGLALSEEIADVWPAKWFEGVQALVRDVWGDAWADLLPTCGWTLGQVRGGALMLSLRPMERRVRT